MTRQHILALSGLPEHVEALETQLLEASPEYQVFRLNQMSIHGVASALGLSTEQVRSTCRERRDKYCVFNVLDPEYRSFLARRMKLDIFSPQSLHDHLEYFSKFLNFVRVGVELENASLSIPVKGSVLVPELRSSGQYAVLHRSSMITERPVVVVKIESSIDMCPEAPVSISVPFEGFSVSRLLRLINKELQS